LFLMALSWLHRLLKRKSGPAPRTGRTKPGHARRAPALECLSDRIVPSAFHVSTLADTGAGSLRAAVAQANAHPGADVIVFDDGLTGTIALTGRRGRSHRRPEDRRPRRRPADRQRQPRLPRLQG
jgi:hypothetical protein